MPFDKRTSTWLKWQERLARWKTRYSFIQGSDDNDTLVGSERNDRLYGQYGDDTLIGGEGNDRLYGQYGDDTLNGGDGDDFLNGGFGDNILNGDDGNDKLYGKYGQDTLSGGLGDDLLVGGGGKDVLTGGEGSDRFWISTYYGKDGHEDYALITDLAESDTIILGRPWSGRSFNYTQDAITVVSHSGESISGQGIFADGDLIAVVQGVDTDLIVGNYGRSYTSMTLSV